MIRMAYKKFQFAGVTIVSPTTHELNDEYGSLHMDFRVLVVEVINDDPVGEPFAVGTVSVCRINLSMLVLTGSSFLNAIDETAGIYEWGSLTTDGYSEVWDNAYDDTGVLEQISDFLGIESAFIDAQFRSKRLIGLALRGIAAITGFGGQSAMILLAQPWTHLAGDGDLANASYLADLESLTASYERIGFKRLCGTGVTNALTLVGMYKNKKWERLWGLYPKPFRVKNFDRNALIVSMAESRKKNDPDYAQP